MTDKNRIAKILDGVVEATESRGDYHTDRRFLNALDKATSAIEDLVREANHVQLGAGPRDYTIMLYDHWGNKKGYIIEDWHPSQELDYPDKMLARNLRKCLKELEALNKKEGGEG